MPRSTTVWWKKQIGAWCTDIGGSRHMLTKGKANKEYAKEKLRTLLDEQALLQAINGAIVAAAPCDVFPKDAEDNLAQRTYESYRYRHHPFQSLASKQVTATGS